MRVHAAILYALVTAMSAAFVYGSTYEAFRSFSLADPGGAADAVEYVKISRGDPDVDLDGPHFRRWVTPAAARLVRPFADRLVADPELAVRLSFYLVNLTISIATGVVLFALLRAMAFPALLSLLGVAAFATSRATVMATATPMADAIYYLAIAALVFLSFGGRTLALAILLPVLVLSKETILPFLLLPVLTGMRKTPAYWASLAVALLVFVINGRVVDTLYATQGPTLIENLAEHVDQVGLSVRSLLTPGGLDDLQSGFSLLLPLAAAGAWLNARHRYHVIPAAVVATLPIAFALALLSGNTGRMLFAAFPAVTAYALIAIEHVTRKSGAGPS